jgi:hypothetical protein
MSPRAITFTNVGPTTFVGTLGDTAVEAGGTDDSLSFTGVTLTTGESFVFAVGFESSNVGGFNGPTGSVQPGINMFFSGLFGSHAGSGNINDADVHSGVVNASGLTDAYVLQGGNPFGFDNGDAIETTQASGHATFSAEGRGVPEPATWAMMLMGFGGLGSILRRRKAVLA